MVIEFVQIGLSSPKFGMNLNFTKIQIQDRSWDNWHTNHPTFQAFLFWQKSAGKWGAALQALQNHNLSNWKLQSYDCPGSLNQPITLEFQSEQRIKWLQQLIICQIPEKSPVMGRFVCWLSTYYTPSIQSTYHLPYQIKSIPYNSPSNSTCDSNQNRKP